MEERQDDIVADGAPGARRAAPRDSLFLHAAIRRVDGCEDAITVRVRNLSPGGMMAEIGTPFVPGERVNVELRGVGAVTGEVRWREAGRIGIAFDTPIDPQRARKTVAQRASAPARPVSAASPKPRRLFGE